MPPVDPAGAWLDVGIKQQRTAHCILNVAT
jgi:hypothetical protein